MGVKRTLQVLRRGLKRLEEKGWTRGQYARDKDGNSVSPKSKSAVCFCSVGAIDSDGPATNALRDTIGEFVLNWNDQQKSKRPVLSVFRKTIKRLEKQVSK